MPYSIKTKDGIVINNIPDNVAPDSYELKQRVNQIRVDQGIRIADDEGMPALPGSPEKAQRLADEAARKAAREAEPKPPLGDRIIGGIEAAGGTLLGGAASVAGQIVGSVEGPVTELATGQAGTGLAEEILAKRARQFSEPFMPVTEEGQKQLQSVGKALEPLSSLPPIVPGGQVLSTLAPVAGSRIVASAKSLTNKPEGSSKAFLRERIEAGDADVALLGKTIEQGEIVKTPGIRAAKRQGFDDTVLRSVETASPQTKSAMREMLNALKRRRTDADYRATNRSTDVIGKNVFKRYQALNDLRKAKGKAVNEAAKDLSGQEFDIETPTQKFFGSLSEAGVKVFRDDDGQLKANFADVDVSDTAGTRKVVNAVIDRVNRGDTDALRAHKLKTLINDSVEFGKLPTADAKIAKGVENALKSYADDINQQLRGKSEKYANANDDFRSVISPLSEMDRVFKSMLNSSDTAALEAGVGTKAARTIMSNNTGRASMLSVLKEADEALKKNNISFRDDLVKQAVFADELERMFGSEATTSLGGASQRATEKAVRAAFGSDILPDLVVGGVQKARGINDANAIKAIEKLLAVQTRRGKR